MTTNVPFAQIEQQHSMFHHAGGASHYQLMGPKTGELVALVPGASLPLAVWEPLMAPLLDSGFQVLRYDLPGRGHSSPLDLKPGLESDVAQLQQLLENLDANRPVHLVGLASGALSVSAFVQEHPRRVASVALIAPDGVTTLSLREKVFAAPLIGELLTSTIAGRIMLKRVRSYSLRDDVQQFLHDLMRFALRGQHYQKALLAYVRALPLHEGETYYAHLAQSGFRVSLLCGAEDQINRIETTQPLRRLFGDDALHVLDGVGHLPHVEEPVQVARLLSTHFRDTHD